MQLWLRRQISVENLDPITLKFDFNDFAPYSTYIYIYQSGRVSIFSITLRSIYDLFLNQNISEFITLKDFGANWKKMRNTNTIKFRSSVIIWFFTSTGNWIKSIKIYEFVCFLQIYPKAYFHLPMKTLILHWSKSGTKATKNWNAFSSFHLKIQLCFKFRYDEFYAVQ